MILLSTAVEDMLERRIKNEMVPLSSDEMARIFAADAIVGTFSAKIKLAQALGYIDRETARMCDLIREMRNACAHSGRAISFADDELSDVLRVAIAYISDERGNENCYRKIKGLGKLHLMWLILYLQNVIRTGSKEGAIDLLNKLIEDANFRAFKALEEQDLSKIKRRKRRPGMDL